MKMNKKVLALALAAFVATGTATISAANNNDTQKPCTEQTNCNKGDKKDKKDGKKGHQGRKDHNRKGHCNLFQGVELTAEQQTAIKAVREQQKTTEQAAREKNRESFMTELKSILTPEQYQQVEQNATKMKEARAQKMDKDAKGQRGEGRQHQRDGKKAEQRAPRS